MSVGIKRTVQMDRVDTQTLRNMIDVCTEPIVGCNQVVEYLTDSGGFEPRYTCTLCDFVAPSAGHMLNHLIGNKHRNAYIDRFEDRSQSEVVPTRNPDNTRHICCMIEKRMGRMTHSIRTVTCSDSSSGQIRAAAKRIRTDGDSSNKSSSRHVSSTSQTGNSTEFGAIGDTGLAVSEGPLGELLKKLSKCVVKNESDASMALYVSRALLGSLVDYRTKQHPEMAAKLKEMLRTMGGMLRTMAAANPGVSSCSLPVTSSTSAAASSTHIQQQSQQQQSTNDTAGGAGFQSSDAVAIVNTPIDKPPPALPTSDCSSTSQLYAAMQTGAAYGSQTMMVPAAMMGNGVVAVSGNMMTGANPMMAGANPMMAGANPMMAGANPMMAGANPMMAGAGMMCGTGMMGMPNMMAYGTNMMAYGPNMMNCNPNMMGGGAAMMGGPGMMSCGPNMMGASSMVSGSMMGPGMNGNSDMNSMRGPIGPDGDNSFSNNDRFGEGRGRTGGFRGRGGRSSRH